MSARCLSDDHSLLALYIISIYDPAGCSSAASPSNLGVRAGHLEAEACVDSGVRKLSPGGVVHHPLERTRERSHISAGKDQIAPREV